MRIADLTFANPLSILRRYQGQYGAEMLRLFRLHCSRGAVAQLGERLNGIQEVVGSIPIGSTKSYHSKVQLESLHFNARNRSRKTALSRSRDIRLRPETGKPIHNVLGD